MKPYQLSSGNLLADRRADYAKLLLREGDARAAAEIMRGALELAPDWAAGWFRAGEMHEAAGQRAEAVEAWTTALRLDPRDRTGAALKLELAGVTSATSGAPSAFVEMLFDQYAERFEESLVEKLAYRAPEMIFDALRATGRGSFGRAADLGCGTGLMGARLRPVVDTLDGYDISAEMLSRARAKHIYDRLERADLNIFKLPPASADLVVAADVFIYFGRLETVMRNAAAALAPEGLLAFSVEKHDGNEDFRLRESCRYAHSELYVRSLLVSAGLVPVSLDEAAIRRDRDDPVTGMIVVARKQEPAGSDC